MSVTSVTEISNGRNGVSSIEAGSGKYIREYERIFHVSCDDRDDGPATVLGAVGIPAIGAVYVTAAESDAAAYCISRTPQVSSDNPGLWEVRVKYTTDFRIDPGDLEPDPTLRTPKWTFSFGKENRSVMYDLDGQPIVNICGQPFSPPLEIPMTRPIIEIEINKSTFSYTNILDLYDSVNSTIWNGFPIGSVLCDSVTVSGPNQENGTFFWAFKYHLSINFDLWIPTAVLQTGMAVCSATDDESSSSSSASSSAGGGGVSFLPARDFTGVQRRLRAVRDRFGQPLSQPIALNADGGALNPGEPEQYAYFRLYRWADFTSIP